MAFKPATRLVLATMLLGRAGFDAPRMDQPAAALSGGWKKRLSIA